VCVPVCLPPCVCLCLCLCVSPCVCSCLYVSLSRTPMSHRSQVFKFSTQPLLNRRPTSWVFSLWMPAILSVPIRHNHSPVVLKWLCSGFLSWDLLQVRVYLLIAIPLGTCEKAKLVNTTRESETCSYLKLLNAEKIQAVYIYITTRVLYLCKWTF